jgi:hypothetical protein
VKSFLSLSLSHFSLKPPTLGFDARGREVAKKRGNGRQLSALVPESSQLEAIPSWERRLPCSLNGSWKITRKWLFLLLKLDCPYE